MDLSLNEKHLKKVRNLRELFKLLDNYDRLINENLVEPRYFQTVFSMQDIVKKNILRLTKQVVDYILDGS